MLEIAGSTQPAYTAAVERWTEITGKKPLFILLDGTWPEARKMFNKSPYLDGFPVLAIKPDALSTYGMRVAHSDEHLCTAEVAACAFALAFMPACD